MHLLRQIARGFGWIAAALSLALLLAVTGLWVHTCHRFVEIAREHGDSICFELQISSGQVRIMKLTTNQTGSLETWVKGASLNHPRDGDIPLHLAIDRRINASLEHVAYDVHVAGFQYFNEHWTTADDAVEKQWLVPLWMIALASGMLPAYHFVRISASLRGKRRHPGHCLHCGYDLRATPARCPECGRLSEISKVGNL